MRTSTTQFFSQPWSPLRKAQRRSRSSQPAKFRFTSNIQSSASQPALNEDLSISFSDDKPRMLAASSEVGDAVCPTDKADIFIQNDVVVGDGGTILSGSSEALIIRLVPTRDFSPDSSYIFALLVNIRTFFSMEHVMQRLVHQFINSVNSDSMNFSKENRTRLFRHVLRVLAEWVTSLPYDFKPQPMRDRLEELLGMCSVDSGNGQKATDLLNNLTQTLNRLERYELAVVSVRKTLAACSSRPVASETLTGLAGFEVEPKVVAQQLTHIEMERFGMVGVNDILLAVAKGDITNFTLNKGDNICFYVEWFNRLSQLAASEVLRHSRRKHRVQAVEYLIDVAQQCCELGNFNSLMSIVAGLSLPSVARLRKTWSRVDKTKLDILQHQLDPSGNFLSYRATMKAAVWRASHCNEEKIVVPFFVLLLKDLFLIYHGSSRVLPNGHWNFVAISQLAEQLKNVLDWQRSPCNFNKHPQILQYLLVSSVYPENEAMLVSFSLEAADNSTEREQFKQLKTPT